MLDPGNFFDFDLMQAQSELAEAGLVRQEDPSSVQVLYYSV